MGRLDTFVAPRPSRAMIYTMKHVNRIFMLKGIPLLRDVPGLNRIRPFAGSPMSATSICRMRTCSG